MARIAIRNVLVGVMLALLSGACRADFLPPWTNIGPVGGLHLIATDPAAAERAWVVGHGGATYRTVDAGASWTKTEGAACANPLEAQFRSGVLFVKCLQQGVMSTPDGRMWTEFTSPRMATVLKLAPATAPATAIVVGIDGIDRVLEATRDGGLTWQRNEGTLPVEVAAFDSSQGISRVVGAKYAPAGSGLPARFDVFESRSLGLMAWRQIGSITPPPSLAFPCHPLSISSDTGGTLYLVSECGDLFVSRAGGTAWTRVDPLVLDLGPSSGEVRIRVDPSRAGHVLAFNDAVLVETFDGFASRQSLEAPAGGLHGADIAADGTPWFATPYGAYRRVQGASVPLAPVQRGTNAMVAAVFGARSEVLVAGQLRSVDAGRSWSGYSVNGVSDAAFADVPGQPHAAYAYVSNHTQGSSDYSSRLFFSNDATASWTTVSTATRVSNGPDVGFFQPSGPQPGVVYAATVGLSCFDSCRTSPAAVVRSDDGGKSWTGIDAGIIGTGRRVRPSSDPAVVYTLTDSHLYRSTNSGATWTAVWSNAQRGRADSVEVDKRDSATVYVVSSSRIFASETGGVTWREGAPLEAASPQILADPTDVGRAFVVTAEGRVFETRDRARSWKQIAIGPDIHVENLQPPRLAADGAKRTVIVNGGSSIYSIDVSSPRLVLDTDLWWNPAQPGWGVSIAQHENGQMFVVWFTYDAQGAPTWRFMPGGTWTDAQTFTGDLLVATGPTYFGAPFVASRVAIAKVGTGTLRFTDDQKGDVSFVLDDQTRFDSPFVRMAFGRPADGVTQVRHADLWWNPLESGWGITLHQQFGTTFATWFVYDDRGMPTWVIMPEARADSLGVYHGDVYTAAGTPAGPFVAGSVRTRKVGIATISFLMTGKATLHYEMFGTSVSRAIERLPF